MKRSRLLATLAVPVVSVALAACGSSGSSANSGKSGSSAAPAPSTTVKATDLPSKPGSITVGSAAFPENALLATIYGQAMAAKGVSVKYQLNIGERGVYVKALTDGDIGMVPEYSGSILTYFNPSAAQKKPADVYGALSSTAAGKQLAVADYAAAEDKDTITVTRSTASKYSLKSIADLKNRARQLTLGAPAQFKTRGDGVPALAKVYGVTFGRFVPTAAGGAATVNALKNGSIDAADIFSTDGAIAKNNFVSLTDPKNMFAAQNVVPLFAKKSLTKPMLDAVDAVSAKLDTETLAKLVAQVGSGQSAAQVAKAWLNTNSLN